MLPDALRTIHWRNASKQLLAERLGALRFVLKPSFFLFGSGGGLRCRCLRNIAYVALLHSARLLEQLLASRPPLPNKGFASGKKNIAQTEDKSQNLVPSI